MAHDGLARAIYPVHTPLDGDIVFAASTGKRPLADPIYAFAELGALAANVLARAVARGVYEATALPFPGALPSWRDKFALAEPLRAIRRRIGERRRAGHHVGDQTPGHRPERQPPMRVAEREPQPGLARRAADHRKRVRHVRAAPIHGSPRSARRAETAPCACGISRSNCTGVGGASRRANSAPVVSRMPCSIGASA